MDTVEEKGIAETVFVLRSFATNKAGDPTGTRLSSREYERENTALTQGSPLRKAYVVIFTTCCGVFDAVKITTSCGVFY